jgi:hypothetical protein
LLPVCEYVIYHLFHKGRISFSLECKFGGTNMSKLMKSLIVLSATLPFIASAAATVSVVAPAAGAGNPAPTMSVEMHKEKHEGMHKEEAMKGQEPQKEEMMKHEEHHKEMEMKRAEHHKEKAMKHETHKMEKIKPEEEHLKKEERHMQHDMAK